MARREGKIRKKYADPLTFKMSVSTANGSTTMLIVKDKGVYHYVSC